MALIKCSECNQQVSGKASIHQSWDIKQILLMIVVLALTGCGGDDVDRSEKGWRELHEADKKAEDTVRGIDRALVVNLCKEIDEAIKDYNRQNATNFRYPFINGPNGPLTDVDLKMVTQLDLNESGIADIGLKDLKNLPNLRTLELDNNEHITDTGLKEIGKKTMLRRLSLGSNTKITDDGLRELMNLSELEYLNLRGTRITDKSIKIFAKMKELDFLEIGGTKITRTGWAEIARIQDEELQSEIWCRVLQPRERRAYPLDPTKPAGQQQKWVIDGRTALDGEKNILAFKGNSGQFVLRTFGKPNISKAIGQNAGEWIYTNVYVSTLNGDRTTVTFTVNNGIVVLIGLSHPPSQMSLGGHWYPK